ncbi:aromatic prenyltransferase, DMATS type [Saccharopolyspora antimicrobica]|uniref:Aromatic prenyltransferase, DMATS type n=1 Tax=Saccharopolyspora antimicrobica TaxID=455193 RepID=A0A1I5GIV9_9PSEU|nr:tryptophan dimethylallyltransferase family protein [Saccharopolyspora antimicrobica]RKT87519.1 DMATS type aromatic prenyltransferase [Saccharopolyspora antimicrobica]SFO35935.1 aromatic prenyltransferase, DMATS type [Saccharopolyspora antimicrobica]
MSRVDTTLGELAKRQLKNLCDVLGIDKTSPPQLLGELLGPVAARPLSEPPLWPSGVADDATPLEFSVQFEDSGARHLRIHLERLAGRPSPAANLQAAKDLTAELADRYDLAVERLHAVQDIFTSDDPQSWFSWAFSLIFDEAGNPSFKLYFNTDMHGAGAAQQVVSDAFERLGMTSASELVSTYALRREGKDLPTFFAIDLDRSAQARVKLYFRQLDARPADAEHAAAAVPGVDRNTIREFCATLAPGVERFCGRPLMSSYSFLEGDPEKPSNYSLYLPIRDYVPHDAVARERAAEHLRHHGFDLAALDDSLGALTDRPLDARAGLLAHVSLRLTQDRLGTSLYFSSEAYGGTPART